MFSIWWPAFLLPLAMVLGGVAGGVLPGRKYRGPRGVLPSEEQREADRVFCRFLWQFGLVYAALAFMVMRTVRLVSLSGQRWFLIGAVAVEIIGAALMVIPVERTRHALLGADAACMSGSGSAVFGLFTKEETARAAQELLSQDYPRTFLAKTV